MASIVSAFGTRGSNGKALSVAIRAIMRRKAPDTVRPIAANGGGLFFRALVNTCANNGGHHRIISLSYDVAQKGDVFEPRKFEPPL